MASTAQRISERGLFLAGEWVEVTKQGDVPQTLYQSPASLFVAA